MKKSIIAEKSFEFSIKIVNLCKQQQYRTMDFELFRQLIKSGTSIGANVEEALAGQSKKDFIAKMSIAAKEARESNYWLRLLNSTKVINNTNLTEESLELVKILSSIIKTSQANLNG
jgi:four helix bundle protein